MEVLLDNQFAQKELLEKCIKNLTKEPKDRRTLTFYTKKLQKFEELWTQFQNTHKQIVILQRNTLVFDPSDHEYFVADSYSNMEEFVITNIAAIQDKIDSLSPQEKPSVESSEIPSKIIIRDHPPSTSIKLPKIAIEKFNGDYTKWTTFHDLFKSLVHENKSYSPVQKLQYLKLSLEGAAQNLIQHLQITDGNYASAWALLSEQYDNKRVLVNTQLDVLTSQTPLTTESVNGIRNILDTTTECLHALTNLNIDVTNWDPFLVHLIVKLLPSTTHQLWEQAISDKGDLPCWKTLQDFLKMRFRTLEAISPIGSRQREGLQRVKNATLNRRSFHTFTAPLCQVCAQMHSIRQCPQFLSFPTQQRMNVIRSKGICMNCLGSGHVSANCPSKRNCKHCNRRHHSLLHTSLNTMNSGKTNDNRSTTENVAAEASTVKPATPADLRSFVVNQSQSDEVLLATALVRVVSPTGQEQIARALVDQGSQVSIITEALAQDLKLQRTTVSVNIKSVDKKVVSHTKSSAQFRIKSLYNDDFCVPVSGLVIKQITDLLPTTPVSHGRWNHLGQLELADPEFHLPGKIDLLLGAGVYGKILMQGVILGTDGSPTAQKTQIGWILSGEVEEQAQTPINVHVHTCIELDDRLKKFWELEEVGESSMYTEEENECETLFQKTTTRSANGRYEVQLPLKPATNIHHLGKSRHIAVSRLLQMERIFAKDPNLQEDYRRCLNEYIELGHMEKVKSLEAEHSYFLNQNVAYSCSYLPHHGVKKETSSTTKLRVVFDASKATDSGIALNDMMLKGPTVQDELTSLLIRWRKYRIAFSADLEKMYRQVRVRCQDADYQRIVWRDSPNMPIEDYKLCTVTFGTKSAPYLATRVLKQLALDEKERYPEASEITLSDFYVDDLLSGQHTIEDALEVQQQLLNLMKAGGFSLRKWSSNCTKLLESLPPEFCETNPNLEITNDDTIRALGTFWNPRTDMLTFSYIQSDNPSKWTKRNILSETAKLFDPPGLLAPIIIQAKIMIQRLWLRGLGWDEEVPQDLKDGWVQYRNNLAEINKIKINRWIYYSGDDTKTELHGFADASSKAYAAAVYLCTIDNQGNRTSYLVAAKTKVAPLKTVTLPRLELCAATLLVKLIRYVTNALKLNKPCPTYAWTDSEIVLAWLRDHPTRWSTFVANRVSYIHQVLGRNVWNHVPTKQNPADCASRGMTPGELLNHELWWVGPTWLRKDEDQWPKAKSTVNMELEQRKTWIVSHVQTNEESYDWSIKYSSLTRLLRVTAYCLRFAFNIQRKPTERKLGFLKAEELKTALHFWLKLHQQKLFPNEFNSLKQNQSLPKSSGLLKLCPFIDEIGLLRVGGRLRYAELPFGERFPIILPDKGHLTTLIIDKIHKDTLHGGPQLMMHVLAKTYWLMNSRNTIRFHIHKCIICVKQRAQTHSQLMGALPAPRLLISRPFTNTGVDYCGPFDMKTHKGRNPKKYKAYIALFVCMTTKALHLEIVTDLSAEGFIAAFRRFSARRGLCHNLYCDCGTNFVGASKVLRQQHQQLMQQINEEFGASLENEGIKFHFIPPSSPHFGGLWEAGVKSTKFHIKRVIGAHSLTYEEFATVLTQIEACLNSRPLTEMSSDPGDLNPLTPGHFLIGDSLMTPPEPSVLDVQMNRLDRWQLLQRLLQGFWKRWKSEYLNRLQQRPKWTIPRENVKVNELVIIKEDSLPPSRWALGRIVSTHAGEDGLVRVVSIRTKDKVLKRPITKICRLPIQTQEENSTNLN